MKNVHVDDDLFLFIEQASRMMKVKTNSLAECFLNIGALMFWNKIFPAIGSAEGLILSIDDADIIISSGLAEVMHMEIKAAHDFNHNEIPLSILERKSSTL